MSEQGRVVKAGSKVRLALASDEWLVACVRRGDTAAFETLYDRHVRELLAFCVYMLGSRQDAEDAVQATFTSAYRALRADARPITLRPWLFTIARNDCLTILRRRRPMVELNGEVDPGLDPVAQIEVKDEVRNVFAGLRELPENQRAALVMAEVHGLSQQEIGGVLGVRADQVKAYVYQARSKLISDRRARDADCHEIREELASARGAALLRGRLRRHVRSCPECRRFADGMARQRRQLGALLPIAPSLALKYHAVEEAMNAGASEPATIAGGAAVGASVAGTAADVAGGGMKLLACKVAAGVVCLGAGAGAGVSAIEAPASSLRQGASTAAVAGAGALASAQEPGGSNGWSATVPAFQGGVTGTGRGAEQGVRTDSGLPAGPTAGGPAPGEAGKKGDSTGDGAGALHGETSSGEGSQQAGPAIHERDQPAGQREAKLTDAQERSRLRRESNERAAEQRRLAREAPKPPKTSSRTPPSEQELAERHEHRKQLNEEKRPEGHSSFPETAEERAERQERRKRKVEERRRRKRAEEEARAAEETAPAP